MGKTLCGTLVWKPHEVHPPSVVCSAGSGLEKREVKSLIAPRVAVLENTGMSCEEFSKAVLRTLVAVTLAWFSFVDAVRGDDWPQFRGPHRDGTWNETGLLKTFPAGGLEIAWRQPIGWGWSSPVVAQGRVFLVDAELNKPRAKERVLCFEGTTGKTLWTFAYDVSYPDWVFVPGQSGGPTATPIIEANRIYTLGSNGHVHCLDTHTGAMIWEKDLGKLYEVREMQCRPSPLIDGDRLIVFTGAKPGASVLALDTMTGNEIWKALDDAVSNSSPLMITAGGQRQLIVWSNDSVTSLDPTTGATWWRERMTTSGNDSVPTPVVQGNRLLISGLMFELGASQTTATVLWPASRAPSKRLLGNTSSPLLHGDYVYSAKQGGELVCLEAATGALVWKTDKATTPGNGAGIHFFPTPDGVFLFTDEGNLIRAQLAPEGYREISRAHLIDPTTPLSRRSFAWAPPAFADRHVFARNDKELVCASLAAK